jgi:hypothetical protein
MIMKKTHYFIVLLLLAACTLFAQPGDPAVAQPANIMGLKMAFVTKQLSLTNEEAQKFWPVYYSYTAELRKTRQAKKGGDVLEMEEGMLNVRKKYKTEFKKILTADDRVNKALTVDRDFLNVVKKEMQQRKIRGPKGAPKDGKSIN